MLYTLQYSLRAARQLQSLESYITSHIHPDRARRYIEQIEAKCRRICLAPLEGTRRDDLKLGVRCTGYRSRVSIYFEVKGNVVRILSIDYAGKLMPKDLRNL